MLGRAMEALTPMRRLVTRNPAYPYSKPMLAAVLFCLGREVEGLALVDEMRKARISFEPFFADLARQLKSNGRFEYAVATLEPLYEKEIITRDLAMILVECYKAQATAN
jgi:predicted Zn-dependent protease